MIIIMLVISFLIAFQSEFRKASFSVQGRKVKKRSNHLLRPKQMCPKFEALSDNQKGWIIGEVPLNGLCNQLIGIYSYLPLAMIYDVNLIVSGIYSRSSFENILYEEETINLLPFSHFFDWDHFHTFWKIRNITTVEINNYDDCLNSTRTRKIIKNPYLGPKTKNELIEMLLLSKTKLPVQKKVILRIETPKNKANNQFIGLFDFRHDELGSNFLLQIHESLKPAKIIQNPVDLILKELPITFFAVHFRLEGDYLRFVNKTFESKIDLSLDFFYNHKCIRSLEREGGVFQNTPALYLASGLFTSPEKSTKSQEKHAQLLLNNLTSMGFDKVYTRVELIRNIKTKTKITIENVFNLTAEQNAWIDFNICRLATSFIPAAMTSSFSFMVLRAKHLDRALKPNEGHGNKFLRKKLFFWSKEEYGPSYKMITWGI